MKPNVSQYIIKGMQRDLSVSKFNPDYAYENHNVRITSRETDSLYSITNEKGNKIVNIVGESIEGIHIGYAVINDKLVIFSTGDTDRIVLLTKDTEDTFNAKLLYEGNLNFSTENPLETLVSYETENIQKIYFIDGRNQPRFINIAASDSVIGSWNDNSFNFSQDIELNETISIDRDDSGGGQFAAGVVQYAFSYYNLYGQQTAIFYTSDLYYISYSDRGGAPDDIISTAFTITMDNLDTNFDYIRIYAIHRTSLNATPTVRLVTDLATASGTITYTDTGIVGTDEDPTLLLYLGAESIIPETMEQKDGTLFFGNYTLTSELIPEDLRTEIKETSGAEFIYKPISDIYVTPSGFYPYKNNLIYGSRDFKTFKGGEWYRVGAQFQDRNGKWSEVIYLDDYRNALYPNTDNTNQVINLVQLQVTLSADVSTQLSNLGYVRARGVVVYPNEFDREVVLQGIACPTVYKVSDRVANAPFSMSSWFGRPNAGADLWQIGNQVQGTSLVYSNGTVAEFRHNHAIPQNFKYNAEVQTIYGGDYTPYTTNVTTYPNSNGEKFFVDQSIITIHSPELEFDTIGSLSESSLQMRVVGVSYVTANRGDVDILTSTPHSDLTYGFYKPRVAANNLSQFGWRKLIGGPMYTDAFANQVYYAGFMVYPWQAAGAIGNGTRDGATGILQSKKISNLNFSAYNRYFNTPVLMDVPTSTDFNGISGASIYRDGDTLIKIKEPVNSNLGDLNYAADIDNIVTYSGTSYPVVIGGTVRSLPVSDATNAATVYQGPPIPVEYAQGGGNITTKTKSTPVRIQYKSTTHAVVALNYSNTGAQVQMPVFSTNGRAHNSGDNVIFPSARPFWNSNATPVSGNLSAYTIINVGIAHPTGDNVPVGSLVYDISSGGLLQYQPDDEAGPYIPFTPVSGYYYRFKPAPYLDSQNGNYSVDLSTNEMFLIGSSGNPPVIPYRAQSSLLRYQTINEFEPEYGFFFLVELYRDQVNNRFGGTTDSALEANLWVPAGDVVNITSGSNIVIDYTEGDTYYQRYDNLKTYANSIDDLNNIVDINSFMVETRINIDGRYDRNRGQSSNLVMSPTNFNLLNPVYSQYNNFFPQYALNYDKFSLNYFPNSITWTNQKILGETVDSWTNITLLSTLDMDGDKGIVRSLNRFNNDIYCFQDTAISQILFNSRTTLTTEQGVPVEIANSGKVDGKNYLSYQIGTNNKWSINSTPNGLYFADGLSNGIYIFNGGLQCITDQLGFRTWVGDNLTQDQWNPVDYGNMKTHFDITNDDVYFTNSSTSLVFSEVLGQFTSFMSYEKVPWMFNIEGSFYSLIQDSMWLQNGGDYNMFYGEYKPFSVEIIANENEPYDKIFNTLEFRADSFDGDTYLPNNTFDTLRVKNEFQENEVDLVKLLGRPSPLKKKYRIWRANIPRDRGDRGNRDRMRNPWLSVKLAKNNPNTYRTELHDLMVHFFEQL